MFENVLWTLIGLYAVAHLVMWVSAYMVRKSVERMFGRNGG